MTESGPGPRPVSDDDIRHRFSYHPPQSETRRNQHQTVRRVLMQAALTLMPGLPPGREASLVLTHLEEAMMWANAALARSHDPHAGDRA